jgi:phosphoribosylformylglycinamidine cyclo-ligase
MGMIAIVPATVVDDALRILSERGVPSWVCGEIRDRREGEHGDAQAKGGKGGASTLVGAYAY